jgi:RNA-binding protein 39
VTTEPLYQRLYVGSLHFSLTDDDVRQIFEPFGALDFVNLHKGKYLYNSFV